MLNVHAAVLEAAFPERSLDIEGMEEEDFQRDLEDERTTISRWPRVRPTVRA